MKKIGLGRGPRSKPYDATKKFQEQRKMISELYLKQFQQAQTSHGQNSFIIQSSSVLQADFEQLSSEKLKLDKKLESQLTDNETLVKLNMEQSDKISEYENQLRVLQEQVRDRQEILTSAESERSTLQRAILQNKDLKSQLTELQEALIQTNNAKAEAMTESDLLKSQLAKAKSGMAADQSSNSSNEASINQIMQALSEEKQHSAELQGQVESLSSRLRLLEQNNQVLNHQLTVEREERENERLRASSAMSVSEQNSGAGTPKSMGSASYKVFGIKMQFKNCLLSITFSNHFVTPTKGLFRLWRKKNSKLHHYTTKCCKCKTH